MATGMERKWRRVKAGLYETVPAYPNWPADYRVKKLKNGWGIYRYNEYSRRYVVRKVEGYFYPASSLENAKSIAEYDGYMTGWCSREHY